MCLDQLLAGSFGAGVWQAMHGETPGAELSSGVCANCQITTTTLKMQSTKIRISRSVLPFSCERTSSEYVDSDFVFICVFRYADRLRMRNATQETAVVSS